ncbi:nitrogen regulatory protein P-II family [Oryzisolibacter propanilivorax]|uniref:Nitrogen regulatory protein P-II family n=1 Tax=Oryzisolibacter propanilivorax TaxID=1527607 RepID=A0A1G9TWX8_9BURK|nr:P-II family nitrogen regulator [Oryzisolibacter propanilivorax]SDM51765.1 nitrogen regulatory protein P-II family [Oryzisolibacter propanilivorax]
MKQITAILQPHRLEKVEDALHRLPHFPGFTIFQGRGHPRGRGHSHAYLADEWEPSHHLRLILWIYCDDAQVDAIVQTIEQAAHTGQPGDGLIAVSEVIDVVRIRSGERGRKAV